MVDLENALVGSKFNVFQYSSMLLGLIANDYNWLFWSDFSLMTRSGLILCYENT